MKEYYQIHELAKLFELCPDTLRYYEEKGLLHPVRGENRYRQYGIQDICTLNIIRALRQLDLPTRTIRTYLERRSVGETMDLLEREEGLLTRRMEELEGARREAEERRLRLAHYRQVADLRPQWVVEEERPYVFLEQDFFLEKEIDFQLKRLAQQHQDYIQILGSQCMGAAVNENSLKQGIYNHYSRVFFLTRPGLPFDDTLPPGEYARLYYRGPYEALQSHLALLTEFIRAGGRTPAGPPLELYRIDAHDTNQVEEYVTELQIRVEPASQ